MPPVKYNMNIYIKYNFNLLHLVIYFLGGSIVKIENNLYQKMSRFGKYFMLQG